MDAPKGYAKETLADASKAKKLLGWSATVDQPTGIREYYGSIFNK